MYGRVCRWASSRPSARLNEASIGGPGPVVGADEAQAAHHALGDGGAGLGHGERALRAHHLLGDAFGGRPGIRLVAPAIVEHPLVAPLVAVFLEQCGNEGECGIVGHDRGLAPPGLEALDDGRGILHALGFPSGASPPAAPAAAWRISGTRPGRRASAGSTRAAGPCSGSRNAPSPNRARAPSRRSDGRSRRGQIQRLRFSQMNRPPTMATTRTQKNI